MVTTIILEGISLHLHMNYNKDNHKMTWWYFVTNHWSSVLHVMVLMIWFCVSSWHDWLMWFTKQEQAMRFYWEKQSRPIVTIATWASRSFSKCRMASQESQVYYKRGTFSPNPVTLKDCSEVWKDWPQAIAAKHGAGCGTVSKERLAFDNTL